MAAQAALRGYQIPGRTKFSRQNLQFLKQAKKPVPPPIWSSVDQRRRENSKGFIFKIEGKNTLPTAAASIQLSPHTAKQKFFSYPNINPSKSQTLAKP